MVPEGVPVIRKYIPWQEFALIYQSCVKVTG